MTLKAIVSIIKTTNGESPVEPISALVNYENQYKNKEKEMVKSVHTKHC